MLQIQPTTGEGRMDGGLQGTCTVETWLQMSVAKLTTFDMQLNTQRFIENKMLIKKQGMLN